MVTDSDLDADIAAAPAGGPAAAAACEPVWADGILTNPDINERGEIPPLTACVANNKSLAVFPTDDPTVCEDLGLSYPEPLEQDTANEIREWPSKPRLLPYVEGHAETDSIGWSSSIDILDPIP